MVVIKHFIGRVILTIVKLERKMAIQRWLLYTGEVTLIDVIVLAENISEILMERSSLIQIVGF